MCISDRSRKAKTREKQYRDQNNDPLELLNLDAEKHGVAVVCSPKLRHRKQNVKQINGRLLVATFNTCAVKTNIVAVYAPHAGKGVKDKNIFYRDI